MYVDHAFTSKSLWFPQFIQIQNLNKSEFQNIVIQLINIQIIIVIQGKFLRLFCTI